MVPWVGLHGMSVVFPDHTHLLFAKYFAFRFSKFISKPPNKEYDFKESSDL